MARRKAKMPPRNKKNFRPTKAGAGNDCWLGWRRTEEKIPALSLKLPLQARLSPEVRQSVESLSALVLLEQMKKFPKAAKNPNSRLRQAREGGSANECG